MSETIRVWRVPEKVYPDHRPGRDFVGLRKARARDDEATIVYRVPDGFAYVDDGPQDLPNTREIRQALADGDLALAAPVVAPVEPADAEPTTLVEPPSPAVEPTVAESETTPNEDAPAPRTPATGTRRREERRG